MNNQSSLQLKVKAIYSLRPNSEWVWRGEDYSGIEWFDKTQTQPTEEEIEQEIQRLQAEYPRKEAQEQRAAAYKQEADPLFFKYQAGEVSKEEWIAKREEIRQRYPYLS